MLFDQDGNLSIGLMRFFVLLLHLGYLLGSFDSKRIGGKCAIWVSFLPNGHQLLILLAIVIVRLPDRV